MSEYFNRLRTEKELIKLREAKSDWRKELKNNDHPYVDVMPSADQKQKDAEKKVKEEDKKKEEERKDIKEARTPLTAQQRANKDKPSNAITDLFTGDSAERRAARRAAASGDKAGIAKGKADENARAARERATRQSQRQSAERVRDSFSAKPSTDSKPPVKEFEKPSLKSSTETKTKPTFGTKGINPRTGKPYSDTPGKTGTKPAESPKPSEDPKPSTTITTPKPAAKPLGSTGKTKSQINTEYDRLRNSGDTKGAQKFGKDMNKKIFSSGGNTTSTSTPATKPVTGGALSSGGSAARTAASSGSTMSKPSTSVSSIKSPRLASALSDTSSMKFKAEEYKTDKKYTAPEVPGNLQDKDRQEKLDDFTVEKPARKKLDLGKHKKK